MKMPHEAKRKPARPKSVLRRAVLEQAGNRCAFPGCGNQTYLETAHIRAETVGGPRYDPEKRIGSRAHNLIILCPNHHRLVDSQPHRYSVEVLEKFRVDSLDEAQGKPSYSPPVVHKQTPGPKPSNLWEALKVWDSRTGTESEEFWQQLFEDVSELLALAIPGDTIHYGNKCYVGGKNIHNAEGNVVDFLYQSKFTLSVTLVEIKKPVAKLVGSEYRHMHAPSGELIGSVMQALGYRDTLQKDYYSLARDPEERAMLVFNPRALVVIGDFTSEKLSASQRRSFELFRSSLTDVIVLTFDQLFGKVRDIVAIMEAEALAGRR